MNISNKFPRLIVPLMVVLTFFGSSALSHEPGKDYDPKPQIIESYYRVKWGYFDEFLKLYNKYHLPILQAMVARGHMLSVTAEMPKEHMHELVRWDLRVTQVFPDTRRLEEDGRNLPLIVAELFREDMAAYTEGEQRRWELVEEHYDINIRQNDISERKISKW